ncbi:hypothetical protein AU381_04865 [Sinorhizobium glycinis]|uniref:Uncharacterized protein n=1 Tax=Sinorhizobium glycinis TaxID=1472378 RepID=A0A178Y0U9_9HYPH|nr:hypothetical protein [Sinorhizobium glycinis]OAP41209.1 hypothetical protein AU381_04865 [Sinorhizobium glycinis]
MASKGETVEAASGLANAFYRRKGNPHGRHPVFARAETIADDLVGTNAAAAFDTSDERFPLDTASEPAALPDAAAAYVLAMARILARAAYLTSVGRLVQFVE